jgi:hypothetical protein
MKNKERPGKDRPGKSEWLDNCISVVLWIITWNRKKTLMGKSNKV